MPRRRCRLWVDSAIEAERLESAVIGIVVFSVILALLLEFRDPLLDSVGSVAIEWIELSPIFDRQEIPFLKNREESDMEVVEEGKRRGVEGFVPHLDPGKSIEPLLDTFSVERFDLSGLGERIECRLGKLVRF